MRDSLKVFKALYDYIRLEIVKFFLSKERYICETVISTQKIQPTVSPQLSNLENLEIVKPKRKGKKVYYRLENEKVREILKILNKRMNQNKNIIKISKGVLC